MNLAHQQLLVKIDSNANQITQLVYEKAHIWSQYVVFTWRWWLGVAMTVIPWIIWIWMSKTNRSQHRILFSGLFVIIISVALDIVGDQFGLWHYRFNVIPVTPTYYPWDFTLQPVTVMVLLQWNLRVHPAIKAAIFAIVASLIGEPIFHALDVYVLLHWNYLYSLPIQFLVYLIAHAIVTRTHRYHEIQ